MEEDEGVDADGGEAGPGKAGDAKAGGGLNGNKVFTKEELEDELLSKDGEDAEDAEVVGETFEV